MTLSNFISHYGFFILMLLAFPGFISLKIHELVLPNSADSRDFSKSLLDALAIGFLNLVSVYPLYLIYHWFNPLTLNDLIDLKLNISQTLSVYLICVVSFIFFPILWTLVFLRFRANFFEKYNIFLNSLSSLRKRPWDYMFSQDKSYWVIIGLKDGKSIGGIYSSNSRATNYPIPEQIYIEEVWSLNENGEFIEMVESTNGIIIFGSEIRYIEFKEPRE